MLLRHSCGRGGRFAASSAAIAASGASRIARAKKECLVPGFGHANTKAWHLRVHDLVALALRGGLQESVFGISGPLGGHLNLQCRAALCNATLEARAAKSMKQRLFNIHEMRCKAEK